MKKKNLLIFLFLIQSVIISAQTWDGSSNTDWNTAANWTPATVPDASSTVTIPNTANKPVLASNITVTGFNMDAGSALDFNGFTLTTSGSFDINGGTLNNTDAATDITITINGTGSKYIRACTVNDAIIINYNGSTGGLYEGYQAANIFNGNATFNIAAAADFYTCYTGISTFNGNITVNRTVAGDTYIFNVGATNVTGNFSYSNNAGGNTSIHASGTATVPISGTINITATGAGNPTFLMRRIQNQTAGGTVSVQNSGLVSIENDTLIVSAMNVNGFTSAGADDFNANSISGTLNFSDAATNTGSSYFRGNIINGNTTFTSNSSAGFYEGYQLPDTFNGNATFNIAGTADFYTCYTGISAFNGNMTVNRTVAGDTYIFNVGATNVTGNFSYANNAGGNTSIHASGTATVPISGTINITATGAGNPTFLMRRIQNQTAGGTISVQNSGLISIENDTLIVSAMNVNGFTSAGADDFNANSISGALNFSDAATNTGSSYFRGNIINGNTTFTSNSSAGFYEGYQLPDTFNGNATFNIAGTADFYTCYTGVSTFNGNMTVNRTVAGDTYIFNVGATNVTGNFSYTNNAGGNTSIHASGALVIPITGSVNIAASGAGNPSFLMKRIKNQTTGGTISVQNSGPVSIENDTLLLNAMNVNGFASAGADDFNAISITGTVNISDGVSNTGSTYLRYSILNGNFTYTQNSGATFYEAYQGSNVYNGNVALVRNDGAISFTYSAPSYINQNLTLNSSEGITFNDTLFLAGGSNTLIGQLGTQPIIVSRLNMEKTGTADVTLDDSVTISTKLTFNGGNIINNAANPLKFLDNATHSGASDASHVTGLVKKTGNDSFTFPVGSGTSLHSMAITAPGVATDVFSAQYFDINPDFNGYDTSMRSGTLQRISGCEYWDIKRENGASNEALTFSFGDPCPRSSLYITDPLAVSIVHWTGSTWEDLGNGGSTGTTSGTISTASPVSNFSPFTFGTTNVVANPLPVQLVTFTANRQREGVLLQWKAENQVNFSHFEIEKSNGNNHFDPIGIINANANPVLLQYSFRDEAPHKGVNFYRLKMVDINGNFKYSKIEPVLFSNSPAISIYPNPAEDEIRILSSKNIISIEITDVSGKLIKRMAVQNNNRYSINDLRQGIYFIKIRDEGKVTVSKLLVR